MKRVIRFIRFAASLLNARPTPARADE